MSEVNIGAQLHQAAEKNANPNYLSGSARGESLKTGARAINSLLKALLPPEIRAAFPTKEGADYRRRLMQKHRLDQLEAEHNQHVNRIDTLHAGRMVKARFLNQRLQGQPENSVTRRMYAKEAQVKTQGLATVRAGLAQEDPVSRLMRQEHQAHFATQHKLASSMDRYGAWLSGRSPYNRPAAADTRPVTQKPEAAKKAA